MPLPEPLHPAARELTPPAALASYPPVERWSDWEELDPVAWPRKVTRRYSLIPTICFNCEAACGLLAYVDQDTLAIQKFEGNPVHPGSRGRNRCGAKDRGAAASGSGSAGTRCSTTSPGGSARRSSRAASAR